MWKPGRCAGLASDGTVAEVIRVRACVSVRCVARGHGRSSYGERRFRVKHRWMILGWVVAFSLGGCGATDHESSAVELDTSSTATSDGAGSGDVTVAPEDTAPASVDGETPDDSSGDSGLEVTDPEVAPDTQPDSAVTSAEILRLDNMAEEFRAQEGLPGVGIVAFSHEAVVALGVAGLRKHGGTELITDSDKFHLGSCTKAMTATLVAKLVDQGLMDFDASLAELFPDVKVHVELQGVSIRQLLRHEGGVYSDVIDQAPDLWSALWDAGAADIIATRRTFAEAVLTAEPPHTVGTYHYSNTGYILVGAIIEERMSAPWEEVITAQVFEPFLMEGCGFGAAGNPDAEDQPWGHQQKNGQTQSFPPGPEADNPPALGPAGTVHCPLESWARFMMGHLGGGPESYLPPEAWSELHTIGPASQYALGWLVTSDGGLQERCGCMARSDRRHGIRHRD